MSRRGSRERGSPAENKRLLSDVCKASWGGAGAWGSGGPEAHLYVSIVDLDVCLCV